ncbi:MULTISPECIES: hypothetical protein [Vibrio]|uniref:Uncharacterized protein n=2 Tax=Vibrio TaxID=662 RepID=A0ABV4LCZ8_9VIBR|nr:hypothetical protein [Vibrio kanaloae]OEF15634.1 hypothetical protein A132_17415 [Vibrio kanaloae 5S-149]
MHSVSPYSLRCFNKNLSGEHEQRYSSLDNIKSYDLYYMLKDFIESNSDEYKLFEEAKQVCLFSDMTFDEHKRQISGWFNVGNYGMKTEIIDIKTGKVDYEKAQDKAEIIRHYVHFYIPKGFNEAMAFMHSYRGIGVKTLFYVLFSSYFSVRTDLTLQMKPLAYDKAIDAWLEATAKEVRLTKFVGVKDIADQVKKLGHHEQELVIKPPRRNNLGKLKDYLTKGSERLAAVEVMSDFAGPIKTVVELDGKQRTFCIGRHESTSLCEIEISEEDVTFVSGVPELDSIRTWVRDIIKEYAVRMYPNVPLGEI